MTTAPTGAIGAGELCALSVGLMASGTPADFEAVYAVDARNREAAGEPPATRGRGPAAFAASADWLRSAFADLEFEVHEVVVEGDLVAVHVTMSGRHTGTFVVFAPDGRPAQAFPATGRAFAVSQSHWFRVRDGRIVEHWANRDDQGQAEQLGWIPPSPVYLLKMRRALRSAKRTARG